MQSITIPNSASLSIALCPANVTKRDGKIVAFDPSKISSSIARAGEATGEFGQDVAQLLTAWVVNAISRQGQAPHIEAIQDEVENALVSAKYLRTARAYIVYREKHQMLRNDERVVVDVISSVCVRFYPWWRARSQHDFLRKLIS